MQVIELSLLPQSGNRVRVIAHGTGPSWGHGHSMLFLPGQPRGGMTRFQALDYAKDWNVERAQVLAEKRHGSYLTNEQIASLERILPMTVQGAPVTPATVVAAAAPVLTPPPADLIEQRRRAMKALAQIDAQLATSLGVETARAIRDGMARPLNGGKI